MKIVQILLLITIVMGFYVLISNKTKGNPFVGTHDSYKVKEIKTFNLGKNKYLKMERAFTFADKENNKYPISRIQFRDEQGYVIAYTPTRGQAIIYCLSMKSCWVFMWKTVYPLPAIFKFNTNKKTWIKSDNPPMIYSRSGNDGYGFEDVTNPIFGLFGLLLFFLAKLWYFALLITIMIILFMQIVKFHDLPKEQKSFFLKIFMMMSIAANSAIRIDPYLLTVIILITFSSLSVSYLGIPSVHSIIISIATFLFTGTRIAKINKEK